MLSIARARFHRKVGSHGTGCFRYAGMAPTSPFWCRDRPRFVGTPDARAGQTAGPAALGTWFGPGARATIVHGAPTGALRVGGTDTAAHRRVGLAVYLAGCRSLSIGARLARRCSPIP